MSRRQYRRRNLSQRGKVVLAIATGLVGGGLLTWAVLRTRYAQKQLESAHHWANESPMRLPDPSYAVELAGTAEQFAVLDDLVCECGHIATAEAVSRDEESVVADVRDCVLAKLYPDFPWPPIPGDHPSVSRLFTEVEVIARRAIAEDAVCPGGAP
jgi:hypothetical protein